MSTRISSAVALAALMLLAAALPATAGGGSKGAAAGIKAPRGSAHDGTPVVRDHRGDNPRGGGVTVTSKPRPRPICAGWAC
jgi:hypothetical protein